LLHEIALRFKSDGATIAVTAGNSSEEYYDSVSFSKIPVKLMVAENIDKVLEKTKRK
jgi:hypothetical protein